jgi:uncharacterized protein YbjQ (UPF0145 family)
MAMVTGLSGNEIYCLALKDYAPGEVVVGNSVNSMGFLGGIASGFRGVLGGEIEPISQAVEAGRQAAFDRMVGEARAAGAAGVTGVTGELRDFAGNTEFLFVGSAVMAGEGPCDQPFFSSAGSAQELYCAIDAGYRPISHVFGNVAYSIGVGGGIIGSLKTMVRGEITEYSDIFNHTRHLALDRITAQARSCGANAVIGIQTRIMIWHGAHEMVMTGTAAHNPVLPATPGGLPVTSDLTAEELWAMTQLGVAPIKLLIAASVYSLGIAGGFKAMIKAFTQGEISDLTTLVHDARESAIGRLKREADALGADDVVGVKTYIAEIGNGLIEFLAVGTAVRRQAGVAVATQHLPAQAIIADRDTWIEDSLGFQLNRKN